MSITVTGRVRMMLPHRLIEDKTKEPLRLTRMSRDAEGHPEDSEVEISLLGSLPVTVHCDEVEDGWCWGVTYADVTEPK